MKKMSEKQLLILAAANRVVAQFGYEKPTLDDIAEEAGLSRATIYREFAGKHEIYRVQTDLWVAQLVERLNEIPPGKEGLGRAIEESALFLTQDTLRVPGMRKAFFTNIGATLAWLEPAFQKIHRAIANIVNNAGSEAFAVDGSKKGIVDSAVELVRCLHLRIMSTDKKPRGLSREQKTLIRAFVEGV